MPRARARAALPNENRSPAAQQRNLGTLLIAGPILIYAEPISDQVKVAVQGRGANPLPAAIDAIVLADEVTTASGDGHLRERLISSQRSRDGVLTAIGEEGCVGKDANFKSQGEAAA